MKKFLEVLVDDDGHLSFNTDWVFYDEIDNPPPSAEAAIKQNDQLNRMLIEGIIPPLWRDRNPHVGKAIRYLSMAEIISCAEPYDGAEQLWAAMMSEYIPHYEELANRLKMPYGYDPSKITRPIVMDGATIMQMSKNLFSGSIPFPFTGFGKNGKHS